MNETECFTIFQSSDPFLRCRRPPESPSLQIERATIYMRAIPASHRPSADAVDAISICIFSRPSMTPERRTSKGIGGGGDQKTISALCRSLIKG